MKKNWKIVKIPEVLFFQEGPGVRKNQFSTSGVKLLNVGNINEGRINLSKTKIYISEEEAFGKYKHFLIDEGDLVIASSGIVVDNFYNKIAFIEKEHLPLCMNTSTIRFKTMDEKVLNLHYFKFFLKTKFFSNQLQKLITGSAQLNFGPSHLKKIDLILPPIEDQKRIVKILDAADALHQKRKQAITLLDDYLQSSFLQISQKSKQTIKLKLIIKDSKGSSRTGPFGSDLKHSEFVDSGVAVMGIDNAVKNKFEWKERRFITEQKYQKLKRYTIFPRDVIITIMGTVGRSAVIPSDIPLSINTKHLAALTLDESKANPYFVSHAIHSDPRIKRQIIGNSRGAIMSGLNLGIIKNLELPELGIEDQNRFEQIYLRIESIKQKMLTQSQELEVGFQALMQKAFKGGL